MNYVSLSINILMKNLLLVFALGSVCLASNAESRVYFFHTADGEFEQMGSVYGISPNGEYAVIYDEEMEESYLWRKSEPESLEYLNMIVGGKKQPTEVRAVNDNGTIVGSVRSGNQWQPFIKPLGKDMCPLPMTEWALNLNYPCGITNDENIIGGQISRPGGGVGQSCPAIWVKGSDGEYEIISHDKDHLQLPNHQGTNVIGMVSDGTYEGTYLGGSVACGAGSNIPFIYNRDELLLFNKLESHRVPWWYKGQIQGYVGCGTIDGFRDYYFRENDAIMSGFYGVDLAGNFYGARPEVYDLVSTDPEDYDFGNGKVRYHYGTYNVHTGEWTTYVGGQTVSTGLNGEVLFLAGNQVKPAGVDSEAVNASTHFGIDFDGRNVLGVNRTSAGGDVLGFTYSATDAIGAEHGYPAIVVLDSPLVGIDSIEADAEAGFAVVARPGAIEIIGDGEGAIYDMSGVRVGSKKAEGLMTGTYIVTFGGKSRKVAVK